MFEIKKKKTIIIVVLLLIMVAITATIFLPKYLDRTPDSVSNVSEHSTTENQSTITWDEAKNSTSYEVYFIGNNEKNATLDVFEWSDPIKTEMLSVVIKNLKADTDYSVAILSVNEKEGKEKKYSKGEIGEIITFKTLSPKVGTSELTAEAISDNEIKLTWTDAERATEYEILFCDSEDGEYIHLVNLNADINEYSHTELSELQTVFHKIKAALDLDEKRYEGELSEVVSMATKETPKVEISMASTPSTNTANQNSHSGNQSNTNNSGSSSTNSKKNPAPSSGGNNSVDSPSPSNSGGNSDPNAGKTYIPFICTCGSPFYSNAEYQAHVNYYKEEWFSGNIDDSAYRRHLGWSDGWREHF